MNHYIIRYSYTDDRDGRMALLDAHKGYLQELADRGVNVVSGAVGPDEAPGAVLVFRAASKEEAGSLTAGDPFVRGGFVSDVAVTAFIPMSGELAAQVRG